MPSYLEKYKKKISSVHGSFSKLIDSYAVLHNEVEGHYATLDQYVAQIEDIQSILAHAKAQKLKVRAHGSRWSLNDIFHSSGINIINGNPLVEKDNIVQQHPKSNTDKPAPLGNNYFKYLEAQDLTPSEAQGADIKEKYLFCQSGLKIGEINQICRKKNRSLMTSGASNGQSIAGAISTGVHGSTHQIGSIQDTVLGIHLITGLELEDSIYIEPKSRPIVSDQLVNNIGARLIQDDDLFYSALVGLGSMGYIHGVLIETEPIFNLRAFARKVQVSSVTRFINALKIDPNDPEKILVKEDVIPISGHSIDDLFHMKFYINQYNERVVAEILYKEKITTAVRGTPTFFKNNKELIIHVVNGLATLFPFAIPWQMNKQMPKDPPDNERVQTLGETFNLSPNIRHGQYAMAIALPIDRAIEALHLLLLEAKRMTKFPAIFSLRFVKKSNAKMAFTRYDINCLFGIDGADHRNTRKFERRIAQILQDKNIPHTWHWGKSNEMSPAFIKDTYGDDLATWKNCRDVLISEPAIRDAFTNEYMTQRGLS